MKVARFTLYSHQYPVLKVQEADCQQQTLSFSIATSSIANQVRLMVTNVKISFNNIEAAVELLGCSHRYKIYPEVITIWLKYPYLK